jgi:hypothetical protein
MINFKKLMETVYEPRSGDEKNFKDKHVVAKTKTPYDTESQFTSNKSKAKREADHDKGEDEAVYEAADVHTKRKDKEAVIVRSINAKGQSTAKTVWRPAGEIKIGEEVELEEGTVGHGKYTITTGPKMSGMGEGGPSHVVAKRAKMAKLGVPHHDDPGEYGHTVRVIVKNNDTGETTHHHVYQRDTDRGSKEALVSTRTVGTPRAKQKEHEKVLHNYLAGKKVSSLKEEAVVVTELGEKVVNPYAVGMAAAMKATGDTPPLKKSTIVKGHEIAKSIKKEALDPVGKADADIDNDGDVDKSDKYLHNRRKAISKALRKEDLDEAVEVRHDRYMRSHGKKARDSGHGSGNWMFTHKSMGDVDYNNDKEVHTARGSFSDAKKSAQKWAKEHGHHAVYVMEEVDQLDELSPNTLHSYIKKAAGNMAGNAAVAAAQASSSMKKSSPEVKRNIANRMKGITGASGRLADKANMAEEAEQLDEIGDTAKGRKALKAVISRAPEKAANLRMKADILGRRQFDPDVSGENSEKYGKASDTAYKKYQHTVKSAARAVDRLTKEEVDTGENTAELDNSTFKNYIKSNKPNKIKDVNEADAKTNSEASHKKYIKGNEKAPHQSFKEEAEQIDELSKKTLGSYIKKASDRVASNSAEYKSVHSGEDSKRGTFADRLKYKKELSSDTKKRKAGMDTALNKLTKEDLDEAFKVGSMKLHDGSSVTLTRESVDSLNGLFHQLNAVNKSKMEERMMSGKKGFQEILSFAENI